jgi:hypothetical protein
MHTSIPSPENTAEADEEKTSPDQHPLSNTTSPPGPTKPIHPSDTGLIAYLQILGGFLLMFNTWGLILTYGTFQSYYTSQSATSTSPFTANPSTTAWIGSLQAFLLLFVGGLAGRAFDAGYLRALLFTGTFLITVGLMLASLSKAYYQALLSQGVCVGLGMGCLLVPSVGTASTWFVSRRGMAVGVVTSGSAVGGVVLPIAAQHLLDSVGYSWTLRVLGFISLATLSVSCVIMKSRLPPRRRGELIAFRALREPALASYCAGMFVAMLGFYVFLQFVQSVSLSIPPNHPFVVLSTNHAHPTVGRRNLDLNLPLNLLPPDNQRRQHLRPDAPRAALRPPRALKHADPVRAPLLNPRLLLDRGPLARPPPHNSNPLRLLLRRHAGTPTRERRISDRRYDAFWRADGLVFRGNGAGESDWDADYRGDCGCEGAGGGLGWGEGLEWDDYTAWVGIDAGCEVVCYEECWEVVG